MLTNDRAAGMELLVARPTDRNGKPAVAGAALLWLVRLGVMLVLVIPLVVTPGTLFPFVVGKALLARTVIEVTFALWLILIIYRPEYRPPRSWVLIALVVWLAVSLLAGVAGVSFTRSLWSTYERMQGIADLAHWVGYILVAGSVFRTLADWRSLFTVNLAVCAVASALGLGQHYGLFESPILAGSQRIASTLGNATYLGAYTSISALAGLGLLWHSFTPRAAAPGGAAPAQPRNRSRARRRQRRSGGREFRFNYLPWLRGFWGLAILCSGWAMWLTGTRGAVVGLAVAIIVFAVGYLVWGAMPRVRRVCWGLLGVIIAATVLLIVAAGLDIGYNPNLATRTMTQRLVAIGPDDLSVQGRIASVRAGFDAWQDRPLLGWGPENFLIAWGRHVVPVPGFYDRFDQAHSKIVEALTTTGAVGLVSYLSIWLAMAVAMLRSVRLRRDYGQLCVGIMGATMVCYFVQNLFLFDTPGTVMLFAILAAFAASEERWRRENAPASPAAARPRLAMVGRTLDDWRQRLRLWQGLRLSGRSRFLRTPPGVALAALLIAALTVGGTVFYNGRQYVAAAAVFQAHDTSAPWAVQVAHYEWAADSFPGLANYPRIYLISQATWNVGAFRGAELEQVAALVQAAGQEGLTAEPENWRLQIELARFYQTAAARNPEYLQVASHHVAEAVRLAPNPHDTVNIQEEGRRAAAAHRARYDVTIAGNQAMYTKNPCAPDNTVHPFFLHIYPIDRNDLPNPGQQGGFENIDFVFAEYGSLSDGKCTVVLELPEYGINSVRTGQFVLGGAEIWEVTLSRNR